MTANGEKRKLEKFWTWDMFVLVGVNIVFITAIISGILVILGESIPVIAAWLKQVLGL